MTKPLNENMKAVRVENEDGDLITIMDYAGDKLGELVRAVAAVGKAGNLTLKVSVKPSTAGALAIKADVILTKPKGLPPESLLWPTPEGNLLGDNPDQQKLDLRQVDAEPAKTLRNVAAS